MTNKSRKQHQTQTNKPPKQTQSIIVVSTQNHLNNPTNQNKSKTHKKQTKTKQLNKQLVITTKSNLTKQYKQTITSKSQHPTTNTNNHQKKHNNT